MGDDRRGSDRLRTRSISRPETRKPAAFDGVAQGHGIAGDEDFINQLRQKIGVVFGNPETTTGGNALKFYASVRLDVRRIGTVKAQDEMVGARTRVKVVKNKMAPPFKEAEFEIRWGHGIDAAGDLLDVGLDLGLVEKSGNHMSFAGEQLGNGRERARETLIGRSDLGDLLRQAAVAATLPVRPVRAPQNGASAHA